MSKERMVPGYYRQKFHTLTDLMIFHDSSELVKRAQAMPHQDADFDVVRECSRLANKDSRRGDWHHNFELATRGLSEDDATEIFYARQHHREPEFT